MSGFVRTMEKRIMKMKGFVRQTSRVVMLNGIPRLVPFKKGKGPILRPDGEAVLREDGKPSRHWPRATRSVLTLLEKPVSKRRGSRRGKANAAFIATRKAAAS